MEPKEITRVIVVIIGALLVAAVFVTLWDYVFRGGAFWALVVKYWPAFLNWFSRLY